AFNCSVDGENPRTVDVSAGSTASTTFEITCSSTSGAIEVTVATTGDAPDDEYLLILDGGASPIIVTANDTHTFGGLGPGEHEVELGGVAANCSVTSPNPATVEVVAGETRDVSFSVECESLTGTLL